MKIKLLSLVISSAFLLGGCSDNSTTNSESLPAHGAPGNPSMWAYAGKTGIGTSYEQYTDGAYKEGSATGPISKVWFSLAQGIVTETMFGMIHEAQLQEMQLYIKGPDFLHQEKKDTITTIDYLSKDEQGRPLSLAYKIINKDKEGRYEIEKHVFTDPNTQSLMMKVYFHSFSDGITPYLYVNPAIANTGSEDSAVSDGKSWTASEGAASMTLLTDANVEVSTVGFEGVSDGILELKETGSITKTYNTTGDTKGNVAFTLQLPMVKNSTSAEWQFVLGFGNSKEESAKAAKQTLKTGYAAVLASYNGEGDAVGWQDYLASLPALEKLSTTATDGGKLLYTSAMVLKAQEDKMHAGAFIASLSNPWGDIKSADEAATGYKAVWPRDFYQVAMALLALGDKESPKVAFEYLQKVQVTDKTPGNTGATGWFLQKTVVDGTIEWVGVQLDQTAMPIMLGWRLWKEGVLSDADIASWYQKMLKPAADFLVDGGQVNLRGNNSLIKPPATEQERWEEQAGHSPSTTAAVITGLVSAADIAAQAGDAASAERYLAAADKYSAQLESVTFTTDGSIKEPQGNGKYYLRINANEDPNDRGPLLKRNGQTIDDESLIIDGGFLELVRYGVRPANHPEVLETLPEYDNTQLPDQLRVKYQFTFPAAEEGMPGWRRYGIDGYGEDTSTGYGYAAFNGQSTPDQRGRVWPFFTGERGHYELARGQLDNTLNLPKLRHSYVKAMEMFANEGMMLPEQVWDGVGNNGAYDYKLGEGTNAATPLAWTHAEYIKLLRSYSDGKVWDRNSSTEARYGTPKK